MTVCTATYHGLRQTPRGRDALYVLNKCVAEPSGDMTLTQGSCSTAVAASGNTHAGGDAGDLTKFDWSERERKGRLVGFNIHHRLAIKNVWAEHVHWTLLGSTTASAAAKAQNADWESRRGNGLANHGKATGYITSVNIHFVGIDEHTYYATKATQGYSEPNRISKWQKTDTTRAKGWSFESLYVVTVAGKKWLANSNQTFYDAADFTTTKPAESAPPAVVTPPASVVPTWNQPETWKVGGVSADVKRLADRLVVHGFEDYYGNGTDTTFSLGEDVVAVKAFQTAQGWTGGDADGYPGMQTFALLEADPVAAKPAVTKPALRPARATGAAPAKIPSSMSKMYHVASNVWYAVEDSIYGLEAAEAGGYPWADIDIHVTKDGVMVCGHDTSPSDDHFVISAAMKKKYGSHPNIENMTWADVSTLRTPPVKFGGKTITLRYYKVDEILAWMGEHLKVSVSLEMKQSKAFENPKTFEDLRDRAIEHGVDPKRLAIMSIARPAYDHLARFKAAHPYFPTIVLPHDLAKPSNWAAVQPYVDYYRGSWA